MWKTAGGGLVFDRSLRCLSDTQKRYIISGGIYESRVQKEVLENLN